MLIQGLFVLVLLIGSAIVAGEGLREAVRLARQGDYGRALARCLPAGFCLTFLAVLVLVGFWASSAHLRP